MPFTYSNPDNGFSAPQRPMPVMQPEEGGFGEIVNNVVGASLAVNPVTAGAYWSGHTKELSAAFELENDVVNAWELYSRPHFQPDHSFDPEAQLKLDGAWDDHRWSYIGVQSKDEYNFITAKIAKEIENRKVLERAGLAGSVAAMGAGVLSPTMLLPWIGEARGIAAIGKAALLGGIGGVLQEAPLQANQETRTAADSFWSIAGSAVMGGVIGAAHVGISGPNLERLGAEIERIGRGMGDAPGELAIPPRPSVAHAEANLAEIRARHAEELKGVDPNDLETSDTFKRVHAEQIADAELHVSEAKRFDAENLETEGTLRESLGKGASVGAEAVERDAGSLKGMLGVGERLTKIAGPITANLGQRVSKVGRRMTAQLSTAGLRLENNAIIDTKGNVIGGIPSNEGGTVESLIMSRGADKLAVHEAGQTNFANYFFGTAPKEKIFANRMRNTGAAVSAVVNRVGKLNYRQFMEEVAKAMRRGDVHEIPEVAATAKAHREYYDKLLKEAQGQGLIPEELNLMNDLSFLNRIYDQTAINRNTDGFVKIVQDHMKSVLQADFQKALDGLRNATERDTTRLADMDLPAEEAHKLYDQYQDELKALDSMEDDDLGPMEELITAWRGEVSSRGKQIKELQGKLDTGKQDAKTRAPLLAEQSKLRTEAQAFRDEIAKLQELGGPDLEARAAQRRQLKTRIRNLNRNKYFVEEKARAKFEKMDEAEQANLESLRRVASAGQRTMRALDKDAATFERELNGLRASVKDAGTRTARFEEQVNKLHDKAAAVGKDSQGVTAGEVDPVDDVLGKLFQKEEKFQAAVERFNELSQDLEVFQNINWVEGGRREARAAIQDVLDSTLERVNKVNNKRAQRIAKLRKGAEKFDGEAWAAKRKEIEERIPKRKADMRERLREQGADDVDLDKGTANFDAHAKDIAQAALDKIRGTNARLAGFDALNDKRGTELARSLSVPSIALEQGGFLVDDAEQLLNAYHNTLVPDIEIVKRLGPYAPDGSLNYQFKELNEEEHRAVEILDEQRRKKGPLTAKQEEQLKRDKEALTNEFKQVRENLTVTIMRLRHQWGIPQDPAGFAARGVALASAWNGMRLLGGVVWSSLSDLGRPVMKYGLNRTAKTAWRGLVTDWKGIRLTQLEAQRAYVAVETLTAERAHTITDLMNEARNRTKFEQGVHWSASKIGIVAGFSQWTDLMKSLNSMVLNSKLMDSLEMVVTQKAKTQGDLQEATEFLNSLGWSNDMKQAIYDQMLAGGAEKRSGTWIPQTDKWTDPEAVRAYRAALYAENSASIVTPGVELPKIANKNLFFRVLLGLKSFGMASTSKTLMAGLQQHDMAVVNGVWVSVALGALSVYIKTQLLGDEAVQKMQDWTTNEWINRSVDASGILGALQFGAQFAGDATAGIASGDQPQQKMLAQVRAMLGAHEINDPANAVWNDLTGPTVSLAQLIIQAEASGKWTPAEIHRLRTLMPLQNLFYLRTLFDKMENAVGGDR